MGFFDSIGSTITHAVDNVEHSVGIATPPKASDMTANKVHPNEKPPGDFIMPGSSGGVFGDIGRAVKNVTKEVGLDAGRFDKKVINPIANKIGSSTGIIPKNQQMTTMPVMADPVPLFKQPQSAKSVPTDSTGVPSSQDWVPSATLKAVPNTNAKKNIVSEDASDPKTSEGSDEHNTKVAPAMAVAASGSAPDAGMDSNTVMLLAAGSVIAIAAFSS